MLSISKINCTRRKERNKDPHRPIDSRTEEDFLNQMNCKGENCNQHKRTTGRPYYSDDHRTKTYRPKPDNDHRGSAKEILDLRGHVRQTMAYECESMYRGRSEVCSPFAALIPLGIMVFGAEGPSLNELVAAIGSGSVQTHFENMLSKINKLQNIHIASRVYFDNKYQLQDNFKRAAEQLFGACVAQTDLRDTSKAAQVINDWVKKHTNNRIPAIASTSNLPPNAAAVIVNTIYFFGRWEKAFRFKVMGNFYGSSGSRSQSMMCVTGKFLYGESNALAAQVIEIPYQDGQVSMVIVLPNERKGLSVLSSQLKLAPDLINKVRMDRVEISLRIPSFKIETLFDANSLYKRIGVNNIFNNYGLTKIAVGTKLHVSAGLHRVYIDVDADYSVGTGGFGAALIPGGVNEKGPRFNADHPFLFFIVVAKQQLFAGNYQ